MHVMKNKIVKWIIVSISILLGVLLVGGVYFSYQVGKSVGEGCLEIGRDQDTKNNSIKQMEIWGFDQEAFEATYSSEYIELTAKDGNKVPTYYYRMNEKEEADTVILVHGLGGEALCMEPWIEMYGEQGYNVLAIDTRGAGKNKDAAMTYGYNETMDLAACVDYLRTKIVSHKIIIHGQSLGGCMVGIYAATEHANQNVDKIILESPMKSLEYMFLMGWREMPDYDATVPEAYLMSCGSWYLKWKEGFSFDDVNMVEKQKENYISTLVIQCLRDELSNMEDGKEIFNQIGSQDKRYWEIDSDHIEGYIDYPDAYTEAVIGFIEQ